jgi:hypothetical protein
MAFAMVVAVMVMPASLVFGLGSASSAASVCDTTTTGGLWDQAASWENGVPTSLTPACIRGGFAVLESAGDAASVRVAAGATLVVFGNGIDATLTLHGTGSVNDGTVNVMSGLTVGAIAGGELLNRGSFGTSGGTPSVLTTLNTSLRNFGTVTIAGAVQTTAPVTLVNAAQWSGPGIVLQPGAGASFVQRSGTLVGGITVDSGNHFRFVGGGIIDSPVYAYNADVSFGAGATSSDPASTIVLRGSSTLSGDVPADFTLSVLGDSLRGDAHVTSSQSFANRGTLVLQADAPYAASIAAPRIDNHGTLETAPGNGVRSIATRLINLGAIDVLDGQLTVEHLKADSSSIIRVHVSGSSAATRLVATRGRLGGTLDIVTTYTPAVGDTATVIQGTLLSEFAAVTGTDAPGPTVWAVDYTSSTVTLTAT